MKTTVSKLTAAVALALGATATFAATPSVEVSTVSIRYDDLNLSTDAGVSTLYRRLTAAARQVCPDVYSRDLHVVAAGEACQANAISKAVSQVNNSRLAMLHAAHTFHG